MRLYRAICAWLEAHAAYLAESEEPHPEGAGEARSEHAHSFSTPPELHVRSDHEPLYDDDMRKRTPLGFTRR